MSEIRRLPDWLRVRLPGGPGYVRVQGLLRGASLHTVCEEARCPNIGECFGSGTATFLILGDVCTRNCAFCAVDHGRAMLTDYDEPERLARVVQELGLRHAVVTSVTRDDLPDGGAEMFARTILRIREQCPTCKVEVLIPDFKGSEEALKQVMAARPDILNHNVETAPRLYPHVRPQADYPRSLLLLARARKLAPEGLTKSGIMVGLGEARDEIVEVMHDLRRADCDIITIGQYLRPSARHLPIERFYTPEEFEEFKVEGQRLGFKHVESGPLVRSSYKAHRQTDSQEAVSQA
ncbi:MAG: lipoyl synthase [Dehalococcoidia bacterium]|nr:lipoyl synthase [Dehalococcoidia bacterium]